MPYTTDQRIAYTVFNKADSIIQNNYKYTLIYGHQNQRTRSKLLSGAGTLLKTVYYVGPYEKKLWELLRKIFITFMEAMDLRQYSNDKAGQTRCIMFTKTIWVHWIR